MLYHSLALLSKKRILHVPWFSQPILFRLKKWFRLSNLTHSLGHSQVTHIRKTPNTAESATLQKFLYNHRNAKCIPNTYATEMYIFGRADFTCWRSQANTEHTQKPTSRSKMQQNARSNDECENNGINWAIDESRYIGVSLYKICAYVMVFFLSKRFKNHPINHRHI